MPLNNPYGGLGSWAVEHDDEMRRLSKGGISYRNIAIALNNKFGTHYSRSAAIGRAARIGLAKHAASSAPLSGRTAPRKPAMRSVPQVELEQYKLRCAELVPEHVSLIDLVGCRFPYGNGPFTFCNHPKRDGSSYCVPHHFLCLEAPRVPIRRFVGVAA